MPENAHTGQTQAPETKMATSGYAIPLDYAAIAVVFFALGFWAAITATRAAQGQIKYVR